MSTNQVTRFAAVMLATLMVVSFWPAMAANPSPDNTAPTKEQREKMAKVHEKMAACLRTDRTIKECRTEMMQACHDTLGKQECSMMGKGMMMHDMHMPNTPTEGATSSHSHQP